METERFLVAPTKNGGWEITDRVRIRKRVARRTFLRQVSCDIAGSSDDSLWQFP